MDAIAMLYRLDAPALRRLLALAWVAYSVRDDAATLRYHVGTAYHAGAITRAQIESEWMGAE